MNGLRYYVLLCIKGDNTRKMNESLAYIELRMFRDENKISSIDDYYWHSFSKGNFLKMTSEKWFWLRL